jgi:hypothetical protein
MPSHLAQPCGNRISVRLTEMRAEQARGVLARASSKNDPLPRPPDTPDREVVVTGKAQGARDPAVSDRWRAARS